MSKIIRILRKKNLFKRGNAQKGLLAHLAALFLLFLVFEFFPFGPPLETKKKK